MHLNFDGLTDREWHREINRPVEKNEGYTPFKYLAYTVSLFYTELASFIDALFHKLFSCCGYQRKREWWSTVHIQGNATLYLGAIPIQKKIKKLQIRDDLHTLLPKVQAILSVVEPFENHATGLITSPITPKQWMEKGILNLQLSTPDFKTMEMKKVKEGVAFIKWNLAHNRSVYVHCKAGRGRSALVVMCYLMQELKISPDEAFQKMKKARPQVSLDKEKWKTAKVFFETLK